MKTKIIQITSGRGPVECCWVVAQILKYFIEEIKKAKIEYTLLQRELGTENGTLQSATIQLEGKALESFLSNWLGTIQWIGKSSFRKFHKRKNWFIGIYEIEETEQTNLKESDIKFQAIRSSGPGGQHVNKVSSAIRATHTKTGIQVLVMDSRSQHQNRKIALKRLQEKVAEYHNEQLKASVQNKWENHLSLERGNPVRVFTGTDFKTQKKTKSYKPKRQESKNNLRQQK
ncbi:peptide chain release factor H [Flavivirga amylovorans]|uniref:Peptide chain release factor H n=1 Tax=Flavivirga amylovorans TaxID=870486 RepID=A0ABT8WZL3_9FLAO|nr:peptide chain release factor H [Flavivirga amylovorans]MDO5987126.1 peptide chain release factor H [Flavivirga amylovorans]